MYDILDLRIYKFNLKKIEKIEKKEKKKKE